MRVVSLAPSATQTVHALGLADTLVATTAHTDGHPDVGGWLTPDIDAVASYDPDLVLLTDALQDSIDVESLEAEIVHVDPRTVKEVYESILAIEEAIAGDTMAAEGLVDRMKKSFAAIDDRTPSAGENRPTVYCEEWSTPPMAAGNWVPEIVDIAGGAYPFVQAGRRSETVTQQSVESASPEFIILHICGDGGHTDPDVLSERGWDVPAVESDNIYVIDDSLLNRPGPGLVAGAVELANILHDFELDSSVSLPDVQP